MHFLPHKKIELSMEIGFGQSRKKSRIQRGNFALEIQLSIEEAESHKKDDFSIGDSVVDREGTDALNEGIQHWSLSSVDREGRAAQEELFDVADSVRLIGHNNGGCRLPCISWWR